jgi:hypothetical protein
MFLVLEAAAHRTTVHVFGYRVRMLRTPGDDAVATPTEEDAALTRHAVSVRLGTAARGLPTHRIADGAQHVLWRY